ncbi:MAG: HD family phosphohydrolase [Fidelibacterota bacterium]
MKQFSLGQTIRNQFHSVTVKFGQQSGILLILVLLVSFFFPSGQSLKYSYKLNDIAREPIIAPYTFPILKTAEKYEQDLAQARRSVPFVFHRDQTVVDQQSAAIQEFFTLVKRIREAEADLDVSRDLVYRYRYEPEYPVARADFVADSTLHANLLKRLKETYLFVGDETQLLKFVSGSNGYLNIDLDEYANQVLRICQGRWAEGIYNIPLDKIISNEVIIHQDSIPITTSPDEFQDLATARVKATQEFATLYQDEQDIRRILWDGLFIGQMKPNLIYDVETTQRRQEDAIKMVPRFQATVLKNERIIDANMRVTDDVMLKLESLALAESSRQGRNTQSEKILAYLGRLFIIGIVISFFFTFLIVYRSHIYAQPKFVLLISLIILAIIILAYLFYSKFGLHEYLIPVTVAGMVLTILFDARIGFMATVTISILTAIMIGNNMDFAVVALFTSSIAMYNVRKLRTRSQLFTTIFALILASVIMVGGLGLFKGVPIASLQMDVIYLLVVSVLAPIITYGLVGLLEIGFGITTDLTLLELLDFNHPLLKRLQHEANGTFNHSVVVGNLAEACAAAIGAHSLLCRVGAYYHDIGKMSRPEYFIENQFMGKNRHDNLTPTLSAKIILNHVKEGVKMASEYGLPQVVSDFIPMHHGTTRTEYFYHKALQAMGEEALDENQFRYPGPKPNTKETGILMICEAVEAAVRSLKQPDIIQIEEMIDKIIQMRINDGQLDDCPLTLAELQRIKGTVDGQNGMLPVLRGIYHIRIEYPDDDLLPEDNASDA